MQKRGVDILKGLEHVKTPKKFTDKQKQHLEARAYTYGEKWKEVNPYTDTPKFMKPGPQMAPFYNEKVHKAKSLLSSEQGSGMSKEEKEVYKKAYKEWDAIIKREFYSKCPIVELDRPGQNPGACETFDSWAAVNKSARDPKKSDFRDQYLLARKIYYEDEPEKWGEDQVRRELREAQTDPGDIPSFGQIQDLMKKQDEQVINLKKKS